MKIVFVATTPMAVNAFLKGHLRALAKEYQIVLVVNVNLFPLDQEFTGYIRVVHLPFARKISLFRDIRCLFALWILLLREKPAAVHSIMPKTGLLGMSAAFLARCPRRFHTFTGQVWATKHGWRRSALKLFDRIIAMLATTVLADSPSQAHFIESEGLAQTDEVLVLGKGSIGGVDANRFRPDASARTEVRRSFDTQADDCVFLFVGRLTRDKGVHDLVEAFRAVAKGNINCKLWCVGPDEEQIAEQWMETHGYEGERVIWAGPTDQPERYMAAADVFILPSHREGFGLVVIEAAACGIPSIAYAIPGVVDAVADGISGALVPVRNIDRLAEEMLFLSRSPLTRLKLGSQARERVVDLYDSAGITQQWVEFYRAALQTRS